MHRASAGGLQKKENYAHRVAESQPKERERRDADALANPDDPVEKARRLSNKFMNPFRHAHGMWVFSVPTTETMDRYHNGELLKEANGATRRSGYGAIRDHKARIVETLRPTTFEDDLPADM